MKHLFYFLCIIFLISCSKQNNTENNDGFTNNPSGNCVIAVAATTGPQIMPYKSEFEYNNNNFIVKEKTFTNNNHEWTYKYEYNGSGKLVAWAKYTYADYISLKRNAIYNSSNELIGYQEINYDLFSIDTSYQYFKKEQDKLITYTLNGTDTTGKYNRYYQNGNLVQMGDHQSNGNYTITYFEYTDIDNKYYNQQMEYIIIDHTLPNRKLPSKETSIQYPANKIVYENIYTYEITANGYVKKVTNQIKNNFPNSNPFEYSTTLVNSYSCK